MYSVGLYWNVLQLIHNDLRVVAQTEQVDGSNATQELTFAHNR